LKIVFLGDSLTYGYGLRRSEVWTKLIENQLGIEVINKGICGDTTGGMLTRYSKDVLDNKPTHVFIMGGTNDFIMEVPLSVVKANVSTIVHYSLTNNIKPIIGIQIPKEIEIASENWPTLTDFNRINEDIHRYRDWVMQFVQIFKLQSVDFYKAFVCIKKEEERKALYTDGLHLTKEGNLIMAQVFIGSLKNYA